MNNLNQKPWRDLQLADCRNVLRKIEEVRSNFELEIEIERVDVSLGTGDGVFKNL